MDHCILVVATGLRKIQEAGVEYPPGLIFHALEPHEVL